VKSAQTIAAMPQSKTKREEHGIIFSSSLNGVMLNGRSSTTNRKKFAHRFTAAPAFQEKYEGESVNRSQMEVKQL
jgi:hypothetical protein